MDALHRYTARISEIANAFRQSQLLFAAMEFGVFTHLESPRSAKEVARAIHASERGTRILLDGLAALELVEKKRGRYRNAPVASACLVPGREAYQGAILGHTRRSSEIWARLPEAVRSGTGVKRGQPPADELRDFILGMSNIAFLSAPDLLKHLDLARYRHFLDVGGGPGTYTITFLRACPELRATLMDMPPVVEIAREQVHAAGLDERVTFRPGDCTKEDLGEGYDLILISNLVHILGEAENRELVRKCHEALVPGGTLIIKDFLTDPGHTFPPFSLIFAVHMLLHTDAGRTYGEDEVRAWTNAAGFSEGTLHSLTEKTKLWIVDKA